MGCDGGTIPKRDELVRTKKKPEQKDKDSELSFRWRHCNITQQPLQNPIVACQLGKLYSKMSVLEALLDRSMLPEASSHLKSLKDVKELQLTENPAFEDGIEKGDGYVDRQCSPFICPVIGLEMNGKFKFCYLWTCGCVMSERAVKEIKSTFCHKCQKPFTVDDIVILNGNDEDIELMSVNMKARQAQLKASRKAKKRDVEIKTEEAKNATASDTAPVDVTKQLPKVSSELIHSNNSKRLLVAGSIQDPQLKKTKLDYSVAKDPNASKVYKSLFTSHKSAQEQTRAHWVTYNPFYN